MSLAIEQNNDRFYLIGHTFSLKDTIKSLGCKFDAARKQWYATQKEIAEQVISVAGSKEDESSNTRPVNKSVSTAEKIIRGRAVYKGREYYVLQDTRKNDKRLVKLVYKDGSKVFWAGSAEEVQIVAKYNKPKSLDNLAAFVKWADLAKKAISDESELPIAA